MRLQSSGTVNTKKLLLAAILCLAATPVFAQLSDTYVITAAANVAGGNNTRWLTQLSIFNPHFDYELNVSVTLLPTSWSRTGTEKSCTWVTAIVKPPRSPGRTTLRSTPPARARGSVRRPRARSAPPKR